MVLPPVTHAFSMFIRKPFAEQIKKQASHHPKFRHFLISIAQREDIFISIMLKRHFGCSDAMKANSAGFAIVVQLQGQANHRLTTRVQRCIREYATDVAIHLLNEEKAVQKATELLGKTFLFLGAGAAIIFQVQRNAKKEELAELEMGEERRALEEILRSEEFRRQRHEALAVEADLLRQLVELHKQRNVELAIQLAFFRRKLAEAEEIANSRGFFSFFKLRKSRVECCAYIAKDS